jgi:uncharacterized protein YdhG (YjbR/CyaY superfamily)
MKKSNIKFSDINDYHSSFPADIQKILEQLRQAIRQAAPKAVETISYGMPAFRQNKVLVYYALYHKHIGFYPTPDAIIHFKKELENYHTSKGAIQFALNKPLPLALIKKMVEFRVAKDMLESKSIKKNHSKVCTTKDILTYHRKQNRVDKDICDLLLREISSSLPKADNKVWHGHPVWFLDGNPIVGYSKQKAGIRLMFWSGASFDENGLNVPGKKFKDASVYYNTVSDIHIKDLKRWLKKSIDIQWDYKNIVKRKGVLERLI